MQGRESRRSTETIQLKELLRRNRYVHNHLVIA